MFYVCLWVLCLCLCLWNELTNTLTNADTHIETHMHSPAIKVTRDTITAARPVFQSLYFCSFSNSHCNAYAQLCSKGDPRYDHSCKGSIFLTGGMGCGYGQDAHEVLNRMCSIDLYICTHYSHTCMYTHTVYVYKCTCIHAYIHIQIHICMHT